MKRALVVLSSMMLMPLMALADTWTDQDTGITWTYTIQGDGTVSLGSGRSYTAVSKSTTGDLIIPSMIKGKSVTSIGEWAFYDCSGLASVTIPSGVTSIGDYAFYYCSGLASITLPSGMTSIGKQAFFQCMALTCVETASLADWMALSFADLNANPLWNRAALYVAGERVDQFLIPEGVAEIREYAFARGQFTSVTIPNGVTNIGSCAFYWCTELRSVTIPSGVTSIGDHAFYDCSGLMSVTIPSSVTSIGYHVFYGCDSLMSVTIPACVTELSATFPSTYTKIKEVIICDGVTSIGGSVFKYCSGLESVRIPSSVTSIENCAFGGCGRLTSFVVDVANPEYCSLTGMLCSKDGKTLVAGVNGKVTIPSSVTSIGDYAFYKCSGLTSVVIPEGVTNIGNYAFTWCSGLTSVTIPEGVTSIGDSAFNGCSGLTSVSIPSSVTTIGEWAFWGCSGLESVRIPSGVTSIGDRMFSGCSGLTSVSIPSGIKSIGKSAFSGCSGLKSVTIPESVTSIGDHAFSDCSGLESMTIPSGVKSIEDYVISGCSGLKSVTIPEGVTNIGECALSDCSGLMSVKIPLGVTSIGVRAFSGCSGLKSVVIPTSVTSIGGAAFSGCSGLKTMTIPESVASIGGYAFSSCRGLTSVTIKSGVESIGEWAFWNCCELKSVTIPVSVTSVGNGAFSGCASLTSVNVASLAGWMVLSFGNAAANPLSTGAALYVGGEEVTDLEIPEGTMGIGDYAFVGGRFTSVTIPKSVTSINKQAFLDCDNLQTVYVETGDVERVREMMVGSDSGLDFGAIQFVEFEKPAPVVMSPIEYVNLNGATHDNPTSYQEGSSVEFTPPSILTGYHFTGWSPSAILPEMSGPQTVVANWSANSYQIVYLPNGGSGSMSAVDCVYDQEVVLAINGYSRSGYFFNGWATAASGEVIYRPGEKVSNLTAEDGGVVKLYAVWGKAGSQEILWPNWEKTETDCFVSVNDSVLRIDTTVEEGGRLSLYVEGPGTLTFLARGSDDGFYYCERGGRGNYVRNSGLFAEYTYEVKGDGPHTILWITYTKGYLGRDAWGEIKDVCWRGNPLKYGGSDPAPASPTVEGDEYAVVTGDAETGFVIKPSEGKTAVEVTIPQGVDAAKVTVEVSTKVATVKPNGAKVKVVVGDDDITGFLVIPENDGVMNIAAATVKEEIVKEALDPSKDAVIELNAANPRLTTAPTRKGLTYTLYEGRELKSLSKGDSKLGDGDSWTPTITVSGGNAAFYSIDVTK